MKSKNVLLIITGLVVLLGLSAWSISWGPMMTSFTEVQSPEILDEQAGSGALLLTATPEPTEEGGGETEEPIETEEVTGEETEEAASILGDITGTIVNGSGGEVPEGLEVALLVHPQSVSEIITEVKSDGSFIFEDIELVLESSYLVVIDYLGIIYYDGFKVGEPEDPHPDLLVTIYETTNDTSGVVLEWVEIFFEVLSPEFIQVHHSMYISNYGNKTVIPQLDNEPIIQYVIPEEATGLTFGEGLGIGQPYVITNDGFGDPSSILPGQETYKIYYSYTLPFSNGMEWVEPLTIRTGVVELFLPAEKLEIKSGMFEYSRDEPILDEIYNVYAGGMIPAGGELRAEISDGSSNNLTATIILGAVGLVLVGAGVWWWMRPSTSAGDASLDAGSPETIMDEIIALDAGYEDGRIDEDEYLEERAAMKARLKDSLEK